MPNRYKLLIDNQWVETGSTARVVNPYTRETFAEVCLASETEIDRAIRSAQKGFETTRRLASHERAGILERTVAGLRNRKKEIAETIVKEAGKPIKFAEIEVDRAVNTFAIAAEEAKRIGGGVIPIDIEKGGAGRFSISQRFPIGVVAGITPFNFPLNLVAHKVAPSIASGNTLVLKPATKTPVTALILGEILVEAGMIPGMVNVLPCPGSMGEKLVEDQRIRKISFTGSAAVGWHLKNICGKKKITLELGGNAGVIVHSDADLKFAVPRIAVGSFGYAGQTCISVQRILVQEEIFETFTEMFLKEVEGNVKSGDPMDPSVMVGPMVEEKAVDQVDEWVREAEKGGARILTGGEKNGPFYLPTVLTRVGREMKVFCMEVFAPVVTLDPYKTFSEALERVNDSAFGLQAGVFTKNLDHAFAAFKGLEVGGVMINDVPTFRIDNMPYGGVKDSGFGREGVRYAIEEMTEIKLAVFNLGF